VTIEDGVDAKAFEYKFYALGVGLVQDGNLQLVKHKFVGK
jgi:hypothetical protein